MGRLFSLALMWLLLARPAVAGGDASQLFAEGRELAKRGDHTAACRAFAESYALDAAVGTLLNLARCDEELGAPTRAWVRYHEVIERSQSLPERVAYAEQRLEAVKKRIGLLDLRLHAESGSADVFLDGQRVDIVASIPVDPGQHTIEVRSNELTTRRYTVALEAGEHREMVIEPEPPVAPPQAGSPKPANVNAAPQRIETRRSGAPEPRPLRVLGWSLAGVGVAGLALSGVAAGFVLDKKATVEDECSPDLVCSAAGIRATEAGKTWSTIGTVAFIAGGVIGGAGTYLLLSGRPNGKGASFAVSHAF